MNHTFDHPNAGHPTAAKIPFSHARMHICRPRKRIIHGYRKRQSEKRPSNLHHKCAYYRGQAQKRRGVKWHEWGMTTKAVRKICYKKEECGGDTSWHQELPLQQTHHQLAMLRPSASIAWRWPDMETREQWEINKSREAELHTDSNSHILCTVSLRFEERVAEERLA